MVVIVVVVVVVVVVVGRCVSCTRHTANTRFITKHRISAIRIDDRFVSFNVEIHRARSSARIAVRHTRVLVNRDYSPDYRSLDPVVERLATHDSRRTATVRIARQGDLR